MIQKVNILLLGATGKTGRVIAEELKSNSNVKLTIFVRNPQKLADMDCSDINVVHGDVLNTSLLKQTMKEQKVVVASLDGDILNMAKSIIEAMKGSSVQRIIWMTGMGIHNEIKGVRGKFLGILAKKRPEYVQAADLISSCGITYTLLRDPGLEVGNNSTYYLTDETEQPRKNNVDRIAVAKCISDMIFNKNGLGENQSLGITN